MQIGTTQRISIRKEIVVRRQQHSDLKKTCKSSIVKKHGGTSGGSHCFLFCDFRLSGSGGEILTRQYEKMKQMFCLNGKRKKLDNVDIVLIYQNAVQNLGFYHIGHPALQAISLRIQSIG